MSSKFMSSKFMSGKFMSGKFMTGKSKSKGKSKNSKTRKNSKDTQQKIVSIFLEMLNTIKIYHWQTMSYAQHKATDDLYSKLNENIDSFIEIMLGKTSNRIHFTKNKISLNVYNYSNMNTFKKQVEQYKYFLINMNKYYDLNITNNSDLLNIRDEILGNVNQFLYLLTFK